MNELVPPAIAAGLDAGRKASTLAFALRLLPGQRRRDALVFYRFCRTLDDIADSDGLSTEERAASLDAWQRALEGRSALPADLEALVARYRIDHRLLLEILAGVRSDLAVTRYATFEELRGYCWRVASAVGLVSIRIFGCVREESEAYAENLGLALQLTNILRDVGEDAARGRIYIPIEDLRRFHLTEGDFLGGAAHESFAELMSFEAARADEFFERARASLHSRDRRALLPAEIMRAFYQRLLLQIRRGGFRVRERRYRLSRFEKILLALRALISA